MRSVARIGAALAVLALLLVPAAARAGEGFGRLTVDQVESKIGQKNVYIYDNNSRERWTQGHVPTARWVDYAKVTAGDLPADKDATLIFYCANEH